MFENLFKNSFSFVETLKNFVLKNTCYLVEINKETHQMKLNWVTVSIFLHVILLNFIYSRLNFNSSSLVWEVFETINNDWLNSFVTNLNISYLFLFLGCVYTLFLGKIKRSFETKKTLNLLFFLSLNIGIAYTVMYLYANLASKNIYWEGSYITDNLNIFLQFLILFTVLIITWYSVQSGWLNKSAENMLAAIFLVYFLLALLNSETLIMIFISTLGTTLCMAFMMVGSQKTASEAAYKYVIQSAVVGTFFMFGLSILLLSSYGSVNVLEISILSDSESLQGGLSLILLAVLFKLSQFPNHQWAPEVYGGISSPVLGLFLIPMKIGFIGLLYKMLILTGSDTFPKWLLFISSTVSIVLGAWGALRQNTLPRFLGWTSISNVGLILLPLVWFNEHPEQSVSISLIYLTIYSLLLTFLWVVLNTTINLKGENIIRISDLYKIYKNDLSRVTISALLLVLGGVPPFLGFVLKVSILNIYMSNMLNLTNDWFNMFTNMSPYLINIFKLGVNVYTYGVLLFGLSVTLWNYLGVVGVIFRRDVNKSEDNFICTLSNKTHYAIYALLILLTFYGATIMSLIGGTSNGLVTLFY